MSLREDAWARITNAPGAGGTSLTVTTGHGVRFPANTISYPARIYKLSDPGINERVFVGGRSTDSLTPITRNTDGRGAINITAPSGSDGFAIEAVHDLKFLESTPYPGVFLNQTNIAGAFSAWIGTPSSPAKSMQAGDGLRHKQAYIFVNLTGIAHTYTLTLGFGLFGVTQQILDTISVSVPAGATWYVQIEVDMIALSTGGTQTVTKTTIWSSQTGLGVPGYDPRIVAANITFDTAANNFHFLHTGQMDAASASLFFQGYQSFTEFLRGFG